MRIEYLILLASAYLASCGLNDREAMSDLQDSGSLVFATTPVQSPSLLVAPTLKGFPANQRLELTLKIESLQPERITIESIVLNNSNGLNSFIGNDTNQKLIIPVGRDTTITETIDHIHDKKLFHTTGLRGLIDSTYNLAVYYSVEGKAGVRIINLVSKMSGQTFLAYRDLYDSPVHAYSLNTTNGFDEKQRQFLMMNGIGTASPFVHVTEQEVAVSGLNFRIKCFHNKDSVFAEIFAVNHSDMTVRIDTSKIDLFTDEAGNKINEKDIAIRKVTGSNTDTHILGEGDRIIIRIRQHVPLRPEKLWLSFAETFFLSTGKPLFHDNLELIEFPDQIVSQ
jgi:hypothetical protein